MTRRQAQGLLSLVVTIIGLVFFHYRGPSIPSSPDRVDGTDNASRATSTLSVTSSTEDVPATTSTNARVMKVVDGDTFVAIYDGHTEEVKVRLLGVNTPESVDPRRGVQCFGKEASMFLRQLIEGRRVRLEEDPAADERDKYGRLLRNVITATGEDVNALLIREGYANAYVSYPQNKPRKVLLKHLEAEARVAQRGLWNPTTCNGEK